MALRSVSLKVNSDLVGEISERSIEGILSDLKADGYIHSYRKTDKYYPGKDQKSRQNWEDRNGRDFIIVMRKRYGVFFEIPLQVKSSWEKLREHKAYVYPDGSPQTIPCVSTAEMYGAKIMPDLRSQIYDILDPFIEKNADEKWAYKARAASKAASAKVKARNEKKVIEFLEKNPDATLPQIAEATGLSLNTVLRHRKEWRRQRSEVSFPPIGQ